MYKSFKITKRLAIAFNRFPKTAKEVSGAYHNGFCKSTDTINGFDTYYFVLGLYRIMFYVEHKHKCGHCCS
jgi:hypothetical protein